MSTATQIDLTPEAARQPLLKLLCDAGVLTEPQSASALKLLTGGYWNQVFRLRCRHHGADIDWVVKRFVQADANPMFPILPEAEHLALAHLQGKACAPELVAFLPGTALGAILVYQFVPGEPWRGDVVGAAQLLARLHGLEVTPSLRAQARLLNTTPAQLLTQADAMLDKHVGASGCDAVRRLRPRLHPTSLPPVERVWVHTDCGPGNMIASPHGLRLIDWQCPGLGDPLEDLICFASPAIQLLYDCPALDAAQTQALFNTYWRAWADADTSDLIANMQERMRAMRHFYTYRIAAYCAMRVQDTQLAQPDMAAKYRQALVPELALLASLQEVAQP